MYWLTFRIRVMLP